MTLKEILDYPCTFADVEADSIRSYLHALLYKLWAEGEGFSGKRPFGNSGWEHDLYEPLVRMGVVAGGFETYEDEDTGEQVAEGLMALDRDAADKLVFKLIGEVFFGNS